MLSDSARAVLDGHPRGWRSEYFRKHPSLLPEIYAHLESGEISWEDSRLDRELGNELLQLRVDEAVAIPERFATLAESLPDRRRVTFVAKLAHAFLCSESDWTRFSAAANGWDEPVEYLIARLLNADRSWLHVGVSENSNLKELLLRRITERIARREISWMDLRAKRGTNALAVVLAKRLAHQLRDAELRWDDVATRYEESFLAEVKVHLARSIALGEPFRFAWEALGSLQNDLPRLIARKLAKPDQHFRTARKATLAIAGDFERTVVREMVACVLDGAVPDGTFRHWETWCPELRNQVLDTIATGVASGIGDWNSLRTRLVIQAPTAESAPASRRRKRSRVTNRERRERLEIRKAIFERILALGGSIDGTLLSIIETESGELLRSASRELLRRSPIEGPLLIAQRLERRVDHRVAHNLCFLLSQARGGADLLVHLVEAGGNDAIKVAALREVVAQRNEDVLPILRRLVRQASSKHLRVAMINALGVLGSREEAALLFEQLIKRHSRTVHLEVRKALRTIAGHSPQFVVGEAMDLLQGRKASRRCRDPRETTKVVQLLGSVAEMIVAPALDPNRDLGLVPCATTLAEIISEMRTESDRTVREHPTRGLLDVSLGLAALSSGRLASLIAREPLVTNTLGYLRLRHLTRQQGEEVIRTLVEAWALVRLRLVEELDDGSPPGTWVFEGV